MIHNNNVSNGDGRSRIMRSISDGSWSDQADGCVEFVSRASDTSSAYSGSDVVQSSLDDPDADSSARYVSDEEGCSESNSLIVRDRVREYLEKDPSDRTDDDIEFLLDFMQHMPAFSNMTMSMRRALCAVMVFAVVEKSGTVVLSDGEKLDSWSVILNGHVEVSKQDGTIQHLHMGDSFGVTATTEILHHSGTMRTKVDDCQLVCIKQQDFYQIVHKGEQNIVRLEEHGEVVMVTERRRLDGRIHGEIVLRATPSKLLQRLIEENPVDPTYIEDFLLTYRTFLKSSTEVTDLLSIWFADSLLNKKAFTILLKWINNHFIDFESNLEIFAMLEKFELIISQQMPDDLPVLHLACANKARVRQVLLITGPKEESLPFSIVTGMEEKGNGVFISVVEKGSNAHSVGLKRGDQILSVNNHCFDNISLEKAREILKSSTHLVVTVKSNLKAFRTLQQTEAGKLRDAIDPSKLPSIVTSNNADGSDGRSSPGTNSVSSPSKFMSNKSCTSSAQTSKIRKAFLRFSILPKTDSSSDSQLNNKDSLPSSRKSSTISSCSGSGPYLSSSDPELVNNVLRFGSSVPHEAAIRVYKSDQSFRHLIVNKDTSAMEAITQALSEFGITDPCCNFSLCEVTFDGQGVVKTKHLSNHLNNLAERSSLNSRYYLRNNKTLETLAPDDWSMNILRETQVNLLQLHSSEIALQLTLRDFDLFCDIEPIEYINDLFEVNSDIGAPHLARFSELVNEEMFWVMTEVCSEQNALKRTKILKQFIKIAKHCQVLRNFNSMFAVLSGLGHGSLTRLKQTWEKLPAKYLKMFEEMQQLMDPSRNMSKYRNLLSTHISQPPIIPFFPLVKKDLTFIHFGNDSRVDGLVNFDKLRMIAKEIRHVSQMANRMHLSIMGGSGKSPLCNNLAGLLAGSPSSVGSTEQKKTPLSASAYAKKIYDDGQMARAVRTYIANMKVIDSESKLLSMSQQCEPPGKSSSKKIDPSNDPEMCDNFPMYSILGPMFGSDSPKAIRKLMSLSENVKPYHVEAKKSHVSPYLSKTRHSQTTPGTARSNSSSLIQRPAQRSIAATSLSEESSSVTAACRVNKRGLVSKVQSPPVDVAEIVCNKCNDDDSGCSSSTSLSQNNSISGSPRLIRIDDDVHLIQEHPVIHKIHNDDIHSISENPMKLNNQDNIHSIPENPMKLNNQDNIHSIREHPVIHSIHDDDIHLIQEHPSKINIHDDIHSIPEHPMKLNIHNEIYSVREHANKINIPSSSVDQGMNKNPVSTQVTCRPLASTQVTHPPAVSTQVTCRPLASTQVTHPPPVSTQVTCRPLVSTKVTHPPAVSTQVTCRPLVSTQVTHPPAVSTQVTCRPLVSTQVTHPPAVATQVTCRPLVSTQVTHPPPVSTQVSCRPLVSTQVTHPPAVSTQVSCRPLVSTQVTHPPLVSTQVTCRPLASTQVTHSPHVSNPAVRTPLPDYHSATRMLEERRRQQLHFQSTSCNQSPMHWKPPSDHVRWHSYDTPCLPFPRDHQYLDYISDHESDELVSLV